MAIILAGDIDPEKTMEWIEAKFGYMKTKKVPLFEFYLKPQSLLKRLLK
jgi:predicted Zn-dependent peptidase